MRARRPGFTLLELVTALVIAGIAVSVGSATLLGIIDRVDFIRSNAVARDRNANAERLLRQLVSGIDARIAGGKPVTGGPARMRFSTWCPTPNEWMEPCEVDLAFEPLGADLVLSATFNITSGQGAERAIVGIAGTDQLGTFLYLQDSRDGGSWSTEWSDRVPPLAVGVVLDVDTLILPIGWTQ